MLTLDGQCLAEAQTPNGALRATGNFSPLVGVKVLSDPVFRNQQEHRPRCLVHSPVHFSLPPAKVLA
ncbi:MAG: hypothetical protein WCH98_06820 [Verrucomicrobiota bacterium]